MPAYYTKRRKRSNLASKDAVQSVAAVRTTAPATRSGGSYTSTNKTSNARANLKYRTQARPGGVVHIYEDGSRVFVKKPKSANPSRSLTASPRPPRITEDNPNWNPYTMGNKRGYERGGGAKKYRKGRGRPD